MTTKTLQAINAIFCKNAQAVITLAGFVPSKFYTVHGVIYSDNPELGTMRRNDLDIISLSAHFDNMLNEGGDIELIY